MANKLTAHNQTEGVRSMNQISNIWNHPKTSAAGLLIAVVTIAGVLSQQGISLGTAGKGTVVSLLSALATALLGLLAKDPEGNTPTNGSTAKLGAWALIALLLPLPWMQGCSATTVAQDIVSWTPALESAVATVDSTAALLAPADAPIFTAATTGFGAASFLLVSQAKAYLANPSAGVLAQLQTQVVTFQQQINTALLQTGRIVDGNSQQHALVAIQAVSTIVSAILALVQSVSGKAAVARMAAEASIKLDAVSPYLDRVQASRIVAAHYGEPLAVAEMQVVQAAESERHAGF
jgi:multisubunit Na+/H+ antiporter MnhF subunit